MPDLIIIRLYAKTPMTGAEFATALTGLTITVTDLSVTEPTGISATGTPNVVGSATYDPTSASSTIVQHIYEPNPPFPVTAPAAVATAIIVVNAAHTPPTYPEYQYLDLRLTVTRALSASVTQTIVDSSTNFNVDHDSSTTPLAGNDPGAPAQYASLTHVALYLAIPAAPTDMSGSGAGIATVDLPTDGTPPNYVDLYNAVTTVLAADPGGTVDLTTLSAAQCRQIANEIIWNRTVNPLPSLTPGTLENYYTEPNADGHNDDRTKWEGALTTYYTTANTQANALANYVYALSAALACAQKSQTVTQVGFSFPVLPGIADSAGKIDETEVTLS